MEKEKILAAKEDEKKIVLREYPYTVAVEVSSYCNLKCIMCENPIMKRTKGNMDFELYKHIVNESIQFPEMRFYINGYGEPLLNKDILKFVQYASDKGIKKTYMNTNAMLLDESMAKGLVQAGLYCLIVSVDGFKKETYEQTRVGGDRDIVYKNVTRYLELLQEYGNGNQIVEVQLIEMDSTIPEKEEYVEYWTSRGAYVKLKPLLSWGKAREDEKETIDERYACGACNMLQIMWDGTVPICSCGDCELTYKLGNIRDISMSEAWNMKVKQFSEHHLNHEFDKLPPFCRRCTDWTAVFTTHLDPKKNKVYV